MSVVRSVSTSELTVHSVVNENSDEMGLNQDFVKCGSSQHNGIEEISCTADVLTPKAHTLDRFYRPSTMNQHGEKRKKSFFASFRLSKKSYSKGKEEHVSSGSDISHTPEKSEGSFHNQEGKTLESSESKKCEEILNNEQFKPKKHYLNRMSSFVNKVASKVHGNEINSGYGLRSKLERSQTVTGTDLLSSKVDYVSFDKKNVPGLMGIRNHGNTCFMNAVIQCLSHTDILAEYFVLDHYKNDLARCNRINSKKYGTRGEITEHLAVLLKSLWVLRYVPDTSLNLKNIVEKYEPCYRGSNQHDAAEFLMFVLDKVHEDLNTASKKKYKKVKNSYGRPDEIVAAETLANHLRCNSSFIQDIFQAQFRSSLKCPHCLKESNTFDPYLCVSIPIPQKEVLTIFVTVVYLNQQPKQVKIGVTIEASSTVRHLRSIIANDCGICTDQLVLTEIDGEGFHRTFSDNACVNLIQSTDPIYAVELTSGSDCEDDGFLHIMWMNALVVEPVNIRLAEVVAERNVNNSISGYSYFRTTCECYKFGSNGLFMIGIDNGTKNVTLLEPDLDHPLLHQNVDDALSICHPLGGPIHIKLILQWTADNKEKYIIDDVDHIDEHSSVDELKKKPPECAPVTLSDCLQLHTSAEMLSCGDAWHCPTCNRKQQVLKRLNLWSAPQVLVIHLKRFKQVSLSSNSSKLNTIVNFPLNGFDISDHMAGRHITSNNIAQSNALENAAANKVLGGVWSPWKRHKKFNVTEGDHVYDLYAICNHHGRDLQGGHYTAVCRNPTNGKWYTFDDFNIEEIPQEKVIDQDAYILFYQKREESMSPCFTYDSESNHWSYRIPISVLPSHLRIIPSPESKKVLMEDKKDTQINSAMEESENEGGSQNSNSDSTPSSSTLSTSEHEAPTVKDQNKYLEGDNKEDIVSKTPFIDTTTSTATDSKHLHKNSSDDQIDARNTYSLPATTENDVKPSINNKNCEILCNGGGDDDDDKVIAVESDHSDETIPEVRIQPASLEVLASHKYRSFSSSQNFMKMSLQGNLHDASSNGPIGTEIVNGDCGEKLTNGYCSENGSSCDEETPQVRITASSHQTNCTDGSYALHSYKRSHRMSNANKTASFVVIRTPTSSPRSIRDKNYSYTGSIDSIKPTGVGTWRAKIRETYPGTKPTNCTKERRPVSYNGGVQNGKCSTNSLRKSSIDKRQDQQMPNGPHIKTKSISCVMECKERDNRENFLTESSV
ncbi:Ubiquitin carboxyl-terminal hydrolase 43 [Armadillidium nasatum]|uniref:ubiquitinyl hydrolase 1 n=1 Tax=Armadillidium nasatum TaxID=96803 RepID=A0A5N5T080_9CRUS|nr:Ubiquitin carboxyl-terminal hydrolase 43 [Armadillidium nasatum]